MALLGFSTGFGGKISTEISRKPKKSVERIRFRLSFISQMISVKFIIC